MKVSDAFGGPVCRQGALPEDLVNANRAAEAAKRKRHLEGAKNIRMSGAEHQEERPRQQAVGPVLGTAPADSGKPAVVTLKGKW